MINNHFVFIAPAFNASKTLQQMLFSLYGQSYSNWRLILIDDVSDGYERQDENNIIMEFLDHDRNEKVDFICNSEKKWEVANVLRGINMCHDDEIICRIDADDYLCDLDALKVLNLVYNEGYDCVWTAHRWFDNEHYTNTNISGPMPIDANPYVFPWVSSHLKTFRKSLINDINDKNFRGADGEYIKRAGDQAIFLPILNVAKKRTYLPMVTYAYRCNLSPETFQTDDAKFQKAEAEFLRARGFVK